MLEYMLAVTIVTNTLGVLGSVQSILLPNYRLQPPHGRDYWQFWVTWFVLIIEQIGTYQLDFLIRGLQVLSTSRDILLVCYHVCKVFFSVLGGLYSQFVSKPWSSGRVSDNRSLSVNKESSIFGLSYFYPGFILLSGSFQNL